MVSSFSCFFFCSGSLFSVRFFLRKFLWLFDVDISKHVFLLEGREEKIGNGERGERDKDGWMYMTDDDVDEGVG